MVLYEKHSKNQRRLVRWGLASEIAVVCAAFIGLCGTVGAITFENVVSHLKDLNLETYKQSCSVQISQADLDAEIARKETETLRQANINLQQQIDTETAKARRSEAVLAGQNKATYDFAHALARQQKLMANQARVSPVLTAQEVSRLANILKPFSGQSVILRSTPDTTVQRLMFMIIQALNQDSINHAQSEIQIGALYQGVSVAVHSPANVPPLAYALVLGLRSAGINVHTVSIPNVPVGGVAIIVGPH